MGQQIIQQPDGRLAVFDSTVDQFVIVDATPKELIRWRGKRAAQAARESTRIELAKVLDETNTRPYAQFSLTWDEAAKLDREHW